MDKVQMIKNGKGEPAYAVLPWKEYQRLRAVGGEDAMLIRAGNKARHEEAFPEDVARRIVAGEPPLKVFREWRGLSQARLGGKSGVATQYISQIERGARGMGKKVAAKLAKALGVEAESLLL
jgi:DNA-binding XRE family transcriptional regulator